MIDEITINLRALNEVARHKIEKILDEQLNGVPNETNEDALDILRKFSEE